VLFKEQLTSKNHVSYDLELPDITEMSINVINNATQRLFMKYVMNCSGNIRQSSIPCVAYQHMNSLIKQYNKNNNNVIDSKVDKLETKIKIIEDYLDRQSPLQPERHDLKPEVKKGWFF